MLNDRDDYLIKTTLDIAKARAAFDKEIEDHLEELAHEDGFEDGEESGIQKGIKKVISSMRSNEMSLEEISRVTNIPIDEIMEIVKDC